MQINPDARVRAIMLSYMKSSNGLNSVGALKQIDAQTVPVLMDTLGILPVTRQTMDRFVEFMEALDRELANQGISEFKDHPRLKAAIAYFKETNPAEVTWRNDANHDSPLDLYATVRKDIWNSLSGKE
jgi:hypothetical protein